jgi:hypothetical protein
MKKLTKINPRLIAIIVFLSLSAFIYLNTVRIKPTPMSSVTSTVKNIEQAQKDELKENKRGIELPNINAAKSLLELLQRVLPATR